MSVADAPQEIPLAPEPPTSLRPATVTRVDPLGLPDADVADLATPAKPPRLMSLDVFRGITIAAMMVVNNPGSWSHMYAPLGHAKWDGWTPTDLIFPFFLFIVGVAIPFSFGKRAATEGKLGMLAHVWARALSLVLLGLLLHSLPSSGVDPIRPDGFTMLGLLRVATFVVVPLGFVLLLFPYWPRKASLLMPPIVAVTLLALGYGIYFMTRSAYAAGLPESFNLGNGLFRPSQVRFPGVLQRIGVCYGVAATIALLAGWRTVLVAAVVFCGVYAGLMLAAPKFNDDHTPGSLAKEDNLARAVDVAVFDRSKPGPDGKPIVVAKHSYGAYPDPEGLLSTLPAIGSVLLGVLVGHSLRTPNRTNPEKCARLLANGVIVSILGVLLGWWLMPINKQIWTPSFTVFTAGMGMLTLGAVFYLTDVRGRRAWAWPFKVYGMNAIAAFVFAGLIGRMGAVIKVNNPATGQPIGLLQFCKDRVADAVRGASAWTHANVKFDWNGLAYQFPAFDTPNNVSLAWALTFMLAMFVVMLVMYVCRIFLKV